MRLSRITRRSRKTGFGASAMRAYTRRNLVCSSFFGAIAASLTGPQAFAQSAAADLTAPIQRLSDTLIAVMRDGRQTSFQQRYRRLAPVVAQTFDLPSILQLSVG